MNRAMRGNYNTRERRGHHAGGVVGGRRGIVIKDEVSGKGPRHPKTSTNARLRGIVVLGDCGSFQEPQQTEGQALVLVLSRCADCGSMAVTAGSGRGGGKAGGRDNACRRQKRVL
jgi:hypothetical protein